MGIASRVLWICPGQTCPDMWCLPPRPLPTMSYILPVMLVMCAVIFAHFPMLLCCCCLGQYPSPSLPLPSPPLFSRTDGFLSMACLFPSPTPSSPCPPLPPLPTLPRPHEPCLTWLLACRLIPIEELSVGQIGVLRKLSLVKLTAQLELYSYKSKANM